MGALCKYAPGRPARLPFPPTDADGRVRVNKAYWKTQNQNVALKTFQCPDLVPEELADFKRELWLTR